jgi:hypothetical protein
MYFCYLDESGTPQLGAQTSHFILLGVAIPAVAWHEKDQRVNVIKARYGLKDVEVHTGYAQPCTCKVCTAHRGTAAAK